MSDPTAPGVRVTEAFTRIRAIADEALADDPIDQTAQQLQTCVDELALAHLAEREVLVRALLAVEWSAREPYDETRPICPACGEEPSTLHADDCILDAALRKVGVR